jgi:WhiB family transcriptional regulator, redox-sensing transcriptional regulator
MIAEWTLQAACRGGDPNALFVAGAAQHDAKQICQGCVVRYECLGEALDARLEWGIWGGLTESERRALLRRFPGVTNWRARLRAAWEAELAAVAQARRDRLTSAAR